jgi:DNA polymerase III subunit alpha
MFLIFDTETTGLPKNFSAPLTDFDNWPRMVQLAWQLHDETGKIIEVESFIIRPEGFTIPFSAEKVHGISTEKALTEGYDLNLVLEKFNVTLEKTKFLIGHNVEFDISILGSEFLRKKKDTIFHEIAKIDTKEESTIYCALPGGKGGKYKWPNLLEMYIKLFGEGFDEAHNASADVNATARCFFELLRLGVIEPSKHGIDSLLVERFRHLNVDVIQPSDIEILSNRNLDNSSEESFPDAQEVSEQQTDKKSNVIPFTHLHVHTQYSILDGAADIPGLLDKAKADGMVALAITDHGSMFGVKEFYDTARKNGIKPILGCEVYVANRSRFDKSDKSDGSGRHLILLARNLTGYHNLVKLVSYSWIEGFYYKPRVDKELLKKHHEGLIACSACLNGELPYALRHEGLDRAREVLLEYKDIFGDDFYLELQRHPSGDPKIDKEVYEDQQYVNEHLIKLGRETNTLVIATNDVHFINEEDAEAHDRLLCISTGKDLDDPNRMRYTRQEWFKTHEEMDKLFADIPEAIANTYKVAEKIENYELNYPPIMPEFPIPEEFGIIESYR